MSRRAVITWAHPRHLAPLVIAIWSYEALINTIDIMAAGLKSESLDILYQTRHLCFLLTPQL